MPELQRQSPLLEKIKTENCCIEKGEFFDIRLEYANGLAKDKRIVRPFDNLYRAFGREVPTGCSFTYNGRLYEKELLDLVSQKVEDRNLHLPLELAITQAEKEFENLKKISKKRRGEIKRKEGYSIPERSISTCSPFNIIGYICCVFPEGEGTSNRYNIYLMKTEGKGWVKFGKGKSLLGILPKEFIKSLSSQT